MGEKVGAVVVPTPGTTLRSGCGPRLRAPAPGRLQGAAVPRGQRHSPCRATPAASCSSRRYAKTPIGAARCASRAADPAVGRRRPITASRCTPRDPAAGQRMRRGPTSPLGTGRPNRAFAARTLTPDSPTMTGLSSSERTCRPPAGCRAVDGGELVGEPGHPQQEFLQRGDVHRRPGPVAEQQRRGPHRADSSAASTSDSGRMR